MAVPLMVELKSAIIQEMFAYLKIAVLAILTTVPIHMEVSYMRRLI
jgi:hypothetical protein